MNPAHRDRISFMRICSGKFDKDVNYFHVQRGKSMKLSQPQQMMAQEREIVSEAYAGDIIGVFLACLQCLCIFQFLGNPNATVITQRL